MAILNSKNGIPNHKNWILNLEIDVLEQKKVCLKNNNDKLYTNQ